MSFMVNNMLTSGRFTLGAQASVKVGHRQVIMQRGISFEIVSLLCFVC